MKILLKIYEKFLTLLKINSSQKIEPDIENTTKKNITDNGSVIFGLYEDNYISMLVNTPDISDTNNDQNALLDQAENYANFLVYITNGLVHDQIINLVEKTMKDTKDLNKKLFLQNVLYFFPILENELEKDLTKNISKNLPVVRPLNVFRL
jgi:hypothetical protein